MKTTKLSSLVLALIAIVSLADRASAGIIVVAPTANTPGSFQITADITFTINTAGDVELFALDEWVTSDGSPNGSIISPNFSISINGNLPGSYTAGSFFDNLNSTINQITANDGYFTIRSLLPVIVGDTVTVKAGTFSLAAASGFNPQATQTFTGSMFITGDNGSRLSNVVTCVPEPYGLVLGLTAGIAGLFVRRRKGR